MLDEMAQFTPIFEWVVAIGENLKVFIAVWIVAICCVRPKLRLPVILAPPLWLAFMAGHVFYESRELARKEGYDMSLPSIRYKLEAYIETGEGNHPTEILESEKYPPIFGSYELQHYFSTLFYEWATKTKAQDHKNVHEGYNKGFDWFEATLGEPMFYSSAFFLEHFGPELELPSNPDKIALNESLDTAQLRKMEYIVQALGVKPGMNALDIGSGWGRFVEYLAQKGAHVTGVVSAADLAKYSRRLNKHHGENVTIIAKNFYDVDLPAKSFDVISAVEMSEHAGVAKFGVFLKKIISLLKDDGTFYIQCSGLQRGYATGYNNYKELVWGMFMQQHIFPGADSSTPVGWIMTYLEKAGFEVQASHNMGLSYSRTLQEWQFVWESKQDEIAKTYGIQAWRRWHVFLSWCVYITRRGGTTVSFITATKAGSYKARYNAQARLSPGKWVSPSEEALGKLVNRQGDGSYIEKCNFGGYNTSATPCEL